MFLVESAGKAGENFSSLPSVAGNMISNLHENKGRIARILNCLHNSCTLCAAKSSDCRSHGASIRVFRNAVSSWHCLCCHHRQDANC